MRQIAFLVALVLLQIGFVLAAEPLPVSVPPADPRLYYIGRFDTSDAAGPRFNWSHSMVKLRFRGTDVQIRVKDEKPNFYQVVVDGSPTKVIQTTGGAGVFDAARGLANTEHDVEIVRRTEAHAGVGQFQGFNLNAGGELLEKARMNRRIEVIGDSISCGYGNESANEKIHFVVADENAYWTYGAVAARAVGAEYVCAAWSGKKMWPDNTMPEIYERTIALDSSSKWDFSKWQPDAVIINLATNDFGKAAPDEAKWTAAYEAFVKHVRANYPSAMIYLASGSMMNDNWPPEVKSLSTLKRYLDRIESELRAEGETRIRQIHFDPQDGNADGLGGDWHPSVKTQTKMGNKLAEALKKDLNWTKAVVE